jgi:ABC-type transport system involved in cytochrome c biogenesis permease subunit
MNDLEERIARWRHEMAERLGGTAETLIELEDHVREEVNRQLLAGVPVEVAFPAAVERLGQPQSLADEFARNAPVAPWLPVRLALFVLIAGSGYVLGILTPRLGGDLGSVLVPHIAAVTVGYSITLLIGTLAACYLVARLFGALEAGHLESLLRATRHLTLTAMILTLAAILLGGIWAQERLGRFWTWDPREVAALLVALWNATMLLVLTRRLLPAHTTLSLGLAGNVVVALAWFGPPLLGYGLHAYKAAAPLPLGIFVVVQFLLAGLAFLPEGILRRATPRRAA